ncbi:MAG: hypothetical protein GC189_03450 [Alphaproteobacteria bacterium]|nr:hypothetical protein [Alphaproteobacteria bacterium]
MACSCADGVLQNAARRTEVLAAVLEQLAKEKGGFVITETDRRIVYPRDGDKVNSARNPLSNMWVKDDAGALRGFDADDESQLERAIDECMSADDGRAAMNVMLHRKLGPVHASVTRVPCETAGPCLLFRFVDPILRGLPHPKDVMRWMNVSNAVAAVTLNLGTGSTIPEAAQVRNVAVSTIKSQVKTAFSQSRQHSQTKLGVLLNRLGDI